MKIVSGRYGGRKLLVPKNREIRPTSDKVRGAVFNMLVSREAVDGVRVLDGCCGTGALGLEALSRGAEHCMFMDKARSSIELARDNAQNLGAMGQAEFKVQDVSKLPRKRENQAGFDLVFLDPPYNKGLIAQILDKMIDGEWLSQGAWVVCESERSFDLPEMAGATIDQVKIYGEIKVTLLSNNA